MKLNDMRDRGEGDLRQRERELNEQLFKLRFQRATGAMENPSKMREVRREIARIKTILREKTGAAKSASK